MKDFCSAIETIISCLALLTAVITAIATICMLIVTKKQIFPMILKISDNIDPHLERAKEELIYKKQFMNQVISSSDFENAVLATYEDILALMPYLNSKGKQDEDYYLAEWLFNERPHYDCVKNKSKEEIAHFVYSIRKKSTNQKLISK